MITGLELHDSQDFRVEQELKELAYGPLISQFADQLDPKQKAKYLAKPFFDRVMIFIEIGNYDVAAELFRLDLFCNIIQHHLNGHLLKSYLINILEKISQLPLSSDLIYLHQEVIGACYVSFKHEVFSNIERKYKLDFTRDYEYSEDDESQLSASYTSDEEDMDIEAKQASFGQKPIHAVTISAEEAFERFFKDISMRSIHSAGLVNHDSPALEFENKLDHAPLKHKIKLK